MQIFSRHLRNVVTDKDRKIEICQPFVQLRARETIFLNI